MYWSDEPFGWSSRSGRSTTRAAGAGCRKLLWTPNTANRARTAKRLPLQRRRRRRSAGLYVEIERRWGWGQPSSGNRARLAPTGELPRGRVRAGHNDRCDLRDSACRNRSSSRTSGLAGKALGAPPDPLSEIADPADSRYSWRAASNQLRMARRRSAARRRTAARRSRSARSSPWKMGRPL